MSNQLCMADGCRNPRYIAWGWYEFRYCYGHMQMRRTESTEVIIQKEPEMNANVCLKEGCTEPRYVSAKGKVFSFCLDHQREEWRDKAKARTARRKVESLAAEPLAQKALVEPVHAESPAPQPVMASHDCPPDECQNCRAALILDGLRARSAKLAKLIDAVQTELEIFDELGI